jgi:uridylate kinase
LSNIPLACILAHVTQQETIVMSVGGSMVVPDGISTEFLTALQTFIREHIAHGMRFVVIVGGGKTARTYQDAARNVATLDPDDLDWIGIHATRLNAHLLRTIFRDIAHPVLVKDPTEVPHTDKPLIVAAGWRPGRSTDYCAVMLARSVGATKVINLSNIDYVYDKDPQRHFNATPFTALSWEAFRDLLPKEWDPGLSAPFDPIAAKEAHEAGMEVAIINGARLEEVSKYLAGEKFIGTRIS